MRIKRTFLPALVLCTFVASSAPAVVFVTVYGGPVYDPTTQTGYPFTDLAVVPGSTAGNGLAVGFATKYTGGIENGPRAIRWDASGTAAVELGNLGTNSRGFTISEAYAVNTVGTAVGNAQKRIGDANLGYRAVRWDASGTAATELGNLGTDRSGFTFAEAVAVNSAGTAVGRAEYFIGGLDAGTRAVRWDASGTAATELGNLGSDSGYTYGQANDINSAGAIVGYMQKFTAGAALGDRAVRWDASGVAATELDVLSTNSSGFTNSIALAVNSAGSAVGHAQKFAGDTSLGDVAVRWDASGTAITELGNLGTDSTGITGSQAYAINTTSTAVGYARKHTGGTYVGARAVRWDASGAAATELGNLGTDSTGTTQSQAYDVNIVGTAVGYAERYAGDTLLGYRAVLWNFDAVAIDLNTLIDPDSGWILSRAVGISDTNWVSGVGFFDPDGAGPLKAYQRAFLLDVSSAVPEPAGVATLAIACLFAMFSKVRRRR